MNKVLQDKKQFKNFNCMKNLENYRVHELNSKELNSVNGGWSFLFPWELGYLFVDYNDLDKPPVMAEQMA
jgi:bacteriocin-like protein